MNKSKPISLLFICVFCLIAIPTFGQTDDFWIRTNGPFGGDIRAIAVDSEGRIFIGAAGGGIFRSTDNGEKWIEANEGIPYARHANIESIVIDQHDTVYAASNFYGVFRSMDHGDSWDLVQDGPNVTCLAISPNNNHIFAGKGGGGLWRSEDFGETWVNLTTDLPASDVTSIAIDNNGTIVVNISYPSASVTWGLYQSTNNGDNWSSVFNGASADRSIVAVNNVSGIFYAGAWYEGYYSSLDGVTWNPINTAVDTEVYSIIFNEGIAYIGTHNGVFSSSDFATWSCVGGGEGWGCGDDNLNYVNCLAFSPTNAELFAGTWPGYGMGGMFRYSSSQTPNWMRINSGLRNTQITSLAVNSIGNVFAGTFWMGVFRTSDNGDNWDELNFPVEDRYVRALATNPVDDIFAGCAYGLYRSPDNGDTWEQVDPKWNVSSLAVNSNGLIFAGYGGGNGVYRSTDNGDTWEMVNEGLSTSYDVKTLAVNSYSDIFAGTTGDGIFRSTNDGENWSPVLPSLIVTSIAVNPDGHLFAAAYGVGIYRSTNDGDDWDLIPGSPGYAELLAINSEGVIFAGNGLYRSDDDGETWTSEDAGMSTIDTAASAMVFNGEGHIFAGTWGSGVFRSVESTTSEDILTFFDKSVENGTLSGRGSGWLAQLRLGLMRQMLEIASEFIERDRINAACFMLQCAYLRTDGLPWPQDYVKGDATEELADMIWELRTCLCYE